MQYAAGALYTVSKVPAYNIGGNSELATSGPENSTCDMLLMWRVTYNVRNVPVDEVCQRLNEFLAEPWLQWRQRSKLSTSASQHR